MSETTVTTPTKEQLFAARQTFIEVCHKKYLEFIAEIKSLPIVQTSFLSGIHELDGGWLWIKEAILHGNFVQTPTEPNEATTEQLDAA